MLTTRASVRRAGIDDLAALTALGARFVAETPYGRLLQPNECDIETGLRCALEQGAVFVAEADGQPVGLVIGMLTRAWFAPRKLLAVELAWWVDAEHRGRAGLNLLRAFENWAKDARVDAIALSDLIDADGRSTIGELLPRLGYCPVERSLLRTL